MLGMEHEWAELVCQLCRGRLLDVFLDIQSLVDGDGRLRMILICVRSSIGGQLAHQGGQVVLAIGIPVDGHMLLTILSSSGSIADTGTKDKVPPSHCCTLQTGPLSVEFRVPRDQECIIEGIHNVTLEAGHHLDVAPEVDVVGVDQGDLAVKDGKFRVESSQWLIQLAGECRAVLFSYSHMIVDHFKVEVGNLIFRGQADVWPGFG